MLDFYGMRLKNNQTGELERSENWKERYENLNYSGHNYLRITRILKCLGELNYEHLKKPFVEFFLKEIFENGKLKNAKRSCVDYWVEVLRNDNERNQIKQLIESYLKSASGPSVKKN